MTFCLSDIEGSTALWESDPAAMAEALVRHDELIADAVEAHGGRFLKSMGEGDSTVSVFDSAPRPRSRPRSPPRGRWRPRSWPGDLRIAARFGHAHRRGRAPRRRLLRPDASTSPRACARQADGGQIFLSSVTADLVARAPPGGLRSSSTSARTA